MKREPSCCGGLLPPGVDGNTPSTRPSRTCSVIIIGLQKYNRPTEVGRSVAKCVMTGIAKTKCTIESSAALLLVLQAVRCQVDQLVAAHGRQVAEEYTFPSALGGPLNDWFQCADPELQVWRARTCMPCCMRCQKGCCFTCSLVIQCAPWLALTP
eukprot:1484900-Pyramimonas_sp.AAC.2